LKKEKKKDSTNIFVLSQLLTPSDARTTNWSLEVTL